MTEAQLMSEARYGASHIGESRNSSAMREFEALSKFLRESGYHDAAMMTDGLQDFMRSILQEDF